LLSWLRMGPLESFLLSSHHFSLLPHLFHTVPTLHLLPELQLLLWLFCAFLGCATFLFFDVLGTWPGQS
jgi:hypothetical protein